MTRNKLTEYQLLKWYHHLAPAMADFNCGELCAPDNDGVPACCDHEWTIPLLFREEFKFQRRRSRFWRRYPRRTPQQRVDANEFDSYNDWACLCPGPAKCERDKRALVCRLYPFMPFINGRGEVLGMTFIHGEAKKCPLVDRPGWAPPSDYIKGSLRYWKEVFEVFPEERQVIIDLCKNVRRRYRRLGRPVPLFTGEDK